MICDTGADCPSGSSCIATLSWAPFSRRCAGPGCNADEFWYDDDVEACVLGRPAPHGSIGPLLGGNLLGLEIALASNVKLIIDPADLFVPVPQLSGVPLAYRQYRFSVGLQLGAHGDP